MDVPHGTSPTPEPIKFANEESEKAYRLFLEGKADEVLDIYAEQKKLKEASKLPPAEAIKLHLQYQNKDKGFTEKEITDLFNEQYEMPDKPVQFLSESDDEFEARTTRYEKDVQRIENRISRDAKPAVAELAKLSKEIVLPNIVNVAPEPIEPTQEELDVQRKKDEIFIQSVNDGIAKFNGYESTFKDEEVEIKVAYRPTADEKIELQPLIALSNTNAGEFLAKIGWLDDKGEINTSKLAEDLPFILDKSKILQKMVSETGNKRHEASIKAIKNIDYSGAPPSGGDMGKTNQQKESEMVTHFFTKAN